MKTIETENTENVLHYSNYFTIFQRILVRLFVGEQKDELIKALEAKKEGIALGGKNLAELLPLAHRLTLRALAMFSALPSKELQGEALLAENTIKLHALLSFLELKDLVLSRKISEAVFPTGSRADKIFSTYAKAGEIWDKKGLDITNIIRMFVNVPEKAPESDHEHDCDNCGMQGNCPIEDRMREIKTHAQSDDTVQTVVQAIHVAPPTSSKDIN